jgi:DNA-binding GntR family transcriptional regulator
MADRSKLEFGCVVRHRERLAARVADQIRRDLIASRVQAGSQLPSEPALAVQLGVSRATVRTALDKLEAGGVILRRRGLGTFVGQLSIMRNLLNVNSDVSDLIRAAGHEPRLSVLRIRTTTAPTATATRLRLNRSERVVSVTRVRSADDVPVVYEIEMFSTRLLAQSAPELTIRQFGDLLRGKELLYRVFEEDMGIRVASGLAQLRPVLADRRLGSALQTALGSPLMHIEQVDLDQDQDPVMHSLEYHVAWLCEFTILRTR